VFHGTKLAQTDAATIERTKLFFPSAEAHNLKVIGSNPIPATRKACDFIDLMSMAAGFLLALLLGGLRLPQKSSAVPIF
jgi:hypothetical protein